MAPTKNDLRRQLRQIRDAHGPDAIASAEICRSLLGLDAVRDAKSWFIYVSTGSEVGTHELIQGLLSRGETVAVPRIAGPQEIVAQQIDSFTQLRPDDFGILAPPPGEPYHGAIDVCVCPGIAFSNRGDRLGSGRGFYDRYLSANPPRMTIGLAFDCQIIAALPTEPHDRAMDWIITQRRVIHANRASR